MFWRRELSSSVTTVSGSGTSTLSSSASRTASRAAAACSRRLPRPRRSRTSAVSSSAVSNSEATWAKSSSSSGSSCSWTCDDADLTSTGLADQVPADQRGGEGGLVAGGHAGQGLVEALQHAAATDLVGHAGDLGAVDDLAVLGGLEVDDDEVAVGGRRARRRRGCRSARGAPGPARRRPRRRPRGPRPRRRGPRSRAASMSGLTSTSAVNSRASLSSNFVTSISG